MTRYRDVWIGASVSIAAFGVDQATKYLALVYLLPGEPRAVTAFLNLRLGFNTGMAFGMLADAFADRPLTLASLALGILLLLLFLMCRAASFWQAIALSGLIGGAVGNIVDRLRHGGVVDFLDFHFWGYHWPAFNAADAAIGIGVAGLVFACPAVPSKGIQ